MLSSIIQSGIRKCPDELHRLHMDNTYSALPLFIILHEVHDILCSGTVWMNWQGLPKEKMNLSLKSNKQGESLVCMMRWIWCLQSSGLIIRLLAAYQHLMKQDWFLYSKEREMNITTFSGNRFDASSGWNGRCRSWRPISWNDWPFLIAFRLASRTKNRWFSLNSWNFSWPWH